MRSAPLVRCTRRSGGTRRGGHASRCPLIDRLGRQAGKHVHQRSDAPRPAPARPAPPRSRPAAPAPDLRNRRPAIERLGVTSWTVTPVSVSPAASTARWTASPTIPRPPCRGSRLGWMLMVAPAKGGEEGPSQQLVIAGQQGKFRAGVGQRRPMAASRASALGEVGSCQHPARDAMVGRDPQRRNAGAVADDEDRLDAGQASVGDRLEHRLQVRAAAGDEDRSRRAQPSCLRGTRRAARRALPAPRSPPAPPRAPPAPPRPRARGGRRRSSRSPG